MVRLLRRDYEYLNHQMLQTLLEKVNGLQRNKELAWESESESDVDWPSWMHRELQEEIDDFEDPNHLISDGKQWLIFCRNEISYCI